MKNRNRSILISLATVLCFLTVNVTAITQQSWVQLSSSKGELPKPVETTTDGFLVTMLVLDIDKDGLKDVVIGSYTQMYWYKQGRSGDKITFTAKALDLNVASSEDDASSIEAGGGFCDIDGDGDLDIVQGGHSNASVWWWENPFPEYIAGKNWTKYTIKSGGKQCHDQLFGDFNGNGKVDLAVWDNGSKQLSIAEIPQNPKSPWAFSTLATFSVEGLEGLFALDMNNDKIVDILAGHHCVYYMGGTYKTCSIDDSYPTLSRIAGGQFIYGGTPEVLITSGDRSNVINMYSIKDNNLCGNWVKKTVEAESKNRHTLQVGDINKDGNVDFFSGSSNTTSPVEVFYSDGNGSFTKQVVLAALPMHESKLDDIDGDGDLDLICKSLSTGAKATFNIFLNSGSGTVSVKNNQRNRQNTLKSKQNSSMTVYTLQGKKIQSENSAGDKIRGVTLIKTNNGIVRQIGR